MNSHLDIVDLDPTREDMLIKYMEYIDIHQAARDGNKNIVLEGIEKGFHDIHGITLSATRYGHRDIVLEMMKRGSSVTLTLLICALCKRHWRLALDLLTYNPAESLIALLPILYIIIFLIYT